MWKWNEEVSGPIIVSFYSQLFLNLACRITRKYISIKLDLEHYLQNN